MIWHVIQSFCNDMSWYFMSFFSQDDSHQHDARPPLMHVTETEETQELRIIFVLCFTIHIASKQTGKD